MLKPKFSFKTSEKVFISDKYISNGHWMLKRNVSQNIKALKALSNLVHGSYAQGTALGLSNVEAPDMEAIIPKRDGYTPLLPNPSGVEFRMESTEIQAYLYTDGIKKIGIVPEYTELLTQGHAFVKDAKSPLLILDSTDLNGEFVGVVMPVRIAS